MNDMASMWYGGWSLLMVDPPIDENSVGNDVETLLGWRGIDKCLGNMGTKILWRI